MYSCKLFSIYPHNQKYKKNFHKFFSWLISKKVYLPVSIRMITPGLSNGRLKTGVVNMSTPL